MGTTMIQICFSVLSLATTVAVVIVIANEVKQYLKKDK